MTQIKVGSLKCVVLAVAEDQGAVMKDLTDRIGADDVRPFGASAILLHTDDAAATVRDWMREAGALVVEFEMWSGSGDDVPREWLLARGH